MGTEYVTMSTAGDVARGFSRGVTRFALPFPTAARRAASSTGVVKRKRRRSVKKGRKVKRRRRRHAHR